MIKQKVYLAGGFRSNWSDKVKQCSDKFIYKVKDYEQGNTTNDRQSEEL